MYCNHFFDFLNKGCRLYFNFSVMRYAVTAYLQGLWMVRAPITHALLGRLGWTIGLAHRYLQAAKMHQILLPSPAYTTPLLTISEHSYTWPPGISSSGTWWLNKVHRILSLHRRFSFPQSTIHPMTPPCWVLRTPLLMIPLCHSLSIRFSFSLFCPSSLDTLPKFQFVCAKTNLTLITGESTNMCFPCNTVSCHVNFKVLDLTQ